MKTRWVTLALFTASLAYAAPETMRIDLDKLSAKTALWDFGPVVRVLLERLDVRSGELLNNKFTVKLQGVELPSWQSPLAALTRPPCEFKLELYGIEDALFLELHLNGAHAFWSDALPIDLLEFDQGLTQLRVKTRLQVHHTEDTTLGVDSTPGDGWILALNSAVCRLPRPHE